MRTVSSTWGLTGETTEQATDKLGASLAQVVQDNQRFTEGLAQQQELFRILAARRQSEVQAFTKIVVEVAYGGRGVVDVKQICKPDILRGTRVQAVKEWQARLHMFLTLVLESVDQL